MSSGWKTPRSDKDMTFLVNEDINYGVGKIIK
jgi:hypothetical protein